MNLKEFQLAREICHAFNTHIFEAGHENFSGAVSFTGNALSFGITLESICLFDDQNDPQQDDDDNDINVKELCRQRIVDYAKMLLQVFDIDVKEL